MKKKMAQDQPCNTFLAMHCENSTVQSTCSTWTELIGLTRFPIFLFCQWCIAVWGILRLAFQLRQRFVHLRAIIVSEKNKINKRCFVTWLVPLLLFSPHRAEAAHSSLAVMPDSPAACHSFFSFSRLHFPAPGALCHSLPVHPPSAHSFSRCHLPRTLVFFFCFSTSASLPRGSTVKSIICGCPGWPLSLSSGSPSRTICFLFPVVTRANAFSSSSSSSAFETSSTVAPLSRHEMGARLRSAAPPLESRAQNGLPYVA